MVQWCWSGSRNRDLKKFCLTTCNKKLRNCSFKCYTGLCCSTDSNLSACGSRHLALMTYGKHPCHHRLLCDNTSREQRSSTSEFKSADLQFIKDLSYPPMGTISNVHGRQISRVIWVLLFHRHSENTSLISKNRSMTFFIEVQNSVVEFLTLRQHEKTTHAALIKHLSPLQYVA